MRIAYVLASPTWGMHQYTADLANRQLEAGDEVHLVTSSRAPLDRYAPGIEVHTPVATRDSGFSLDAMRPRGLYRLRAVLHGLKPDLVHITGPHLWNPVLLGSLRRAGVPVVHTLHDLHPHTGAAYGRLLYLWNGWVQRGMGHLLVHGTCHAEELVRAGMDPGRLTCTPLTHLFVSHAQARELEEAPPQVRYEPWALFLGRLEAYKGLAVLVEAARRLPQDRTRVVIAGPGDLDRLVTAGIPANVEVRNRHIGDEEAMDLFGRCGLVVLPYVEASQSALVVAAYCFSKPVVVTRAGALPEYVVQEQTPDQTGWVIPPGDPAALADILASSLENPARLARIGEAGRRWYGRQCRSEGQALRRLYHTMAAQSPATREAIVVAGG